MDPSDASQSDSHSDELSHSNCEYSLSNELSLSLSSEEVLDSSSDETASRYEMSI